MRNWFETIYFLPLDIFRYPHLSRFSPDLNHSRYMYALAYLFLK